MTILHMFAGVDFDSDVTHAMGAAFDAACNAMRKLGADDTVQETLAEQIVDAAKKGERDPLRLYVQALFAMGIDPALAKELAGSAEVTPLANGIARLPGLLAKPSP
jgi:hypothetical protein